MRKRIYAKPVIELCKVDSFDLLVMSRVNYGHGDDDEPITIDPEDPYINDDLGKGSTFEDDDDSLFIGRNRFL